MDILVIGAGYAWLGAQAVVAIYMLAANCLYS